MRADTCLSILSVSSKPILAVAVAFTLSTLQGCGSAAPDPEMVAGEAVYKGTCKVCHASGINGAPILGNKKMWEMRAAQGLEVLKEHAMNGYSLMPAKGGNENLTDKEIEQAIKYMLAQLGNP